MWNCFSEFFPPRSFVPCGAACPDANFSIRILVARFHSSPPFHSRSRHAAALTENRYLNAGMQAHHVTWSLRCSVQPDTKDQLFMTWRGLATRPIERPGGGSENSAENYGGHAPPLFWNLAPMPPNRGICQCRFGGVEPHTFSELGSLIENLLIWLFVLYTSYCLNKWWPFVGDFYVSGFSPNPASRYHLLARLPWLLHVMGLDV